MVVRVVRGKNTGIVEQRSYVQAAHIKRAEQEAAMQRKVAGAQPGGILTASVSPDGALSAALLRAAQGR